MSPTARVTDLTSRAAEPLDASPPLESALRLRGEDVRLMYVALTLAGRESPEAARLAKELEPLAASKIDALLVVEITPREAGEEVRQQLEGLTETMTPELTMPSEAGAVLSQRNARRRAELLTEFGALTGEQIAEERSRASNRHALAARWRKDGRIFGVSYRGKIVYPAFQFDEDGTLRPVIAEVLATLPRHRMTDWEVALWWTAANGWLDGQRPVDLLDFPEALRDAATNLAAPPPL